MSESYLQGFPVCLQQSGSTNKVHMHCNPGMKCCSVDKVLQESGNANKVSMHSKPGRNDAIIECWCNTEADASKRAFY